MPLLTSQVHVDEALSNISVAYSQEQTRFIADRIFPSVPTPKLTDKYFVFDRGSYLRSIADLRATGSETVGANYTLSTDTFSCDQYGVHMDLDDYVVGNADAALNIEVSTTRYITEQLLLKREQVFAAAAFTGSVWKGSTTGGDITPGNLWDTSSSTPISDVLDEINSVESKTGRRPNVLVLGKDVYKALLTNADILDRVKYFDSTVVTQDILARVFEVDRVHVPAAISNTAAQGATDTLSFVFGSTNAALYYVPETAGLMEPSAGYMFNFTGVEGGNASGLRVLNYRIDHKHSQRIEALTAFDFKVVSDQLGVFFSACVS